MKYSLLVWPCLAAVLVFTLYGFTINRITVRNATDSAVSVATYRVKKGATAELEDGPVVIESQKAVTLMRPSFKYGYDSELFFVAQADQALLEEKLVDEQLAGIAKLNVGRLHGFNFIISQKDDILQATHSLERDAAQAALLALHAPGFAKDRAIELAQWPIKRAVLSSQPAILQNPYQDTVARVRVGNALSDGERAYREKRKPVVKAALEKFLGSPIPESVDLVVAFVGSGGGNRAATCTAGSLKGAQDIGLFPGATYAVGLSGTTWALGLLNATGCSVDELTKKIIEKIPHGIKTIDSTGLRKLIDALLVKWAFGQENTLVDFYGGLLANSLLDDFGNARQRQHLSEQAKLVADGSRVFPIYTAVSGKDVRDRLWYEYTPFEIGNAQLGLYVPSWAYGRKFDKGVSVDFAPEQSFGYLMGTFGSAFAITVERILREKTGMSGQVFIGMFSSEYEKTVAPKLSEVVITKIFKEILKTRISASRIWNYTYGMPSSSVADISKLSFVDAGLDFNLPYPPISGERPERKADVIIFLDASYTVHDAPEFRKVEQYARRHRLKFPTISYEGIGERTVSIFKNESDASVPLVIYMPRNKERGLIEGLEKENALMQYVPLLKNFDPEKCVRESFCDTFNFNYTPDQVRQLMSLTELNMQVSAPRIRSAIAWKVAQLAGAKISAKSADALP